MYGPRSVPEAQKYKGVLELVLHEGFSYWKVKHFDIGATVP